MKIRVNDVALLGGRKESAEPEEYRQPVKQQVIEDRDEDLDIPF